MTHELCSCVSEETSFLYDSVLIYGLNTIHTYKDTCIQTGNPTTPMIFDPTVIVPPHISRNTFYSAQFFLFDSMRAFVLEYRMLGILLCSLYISTLMHWNSVRRLSVIKLVDIILAVTALSHVTFVDSRRFTPYYQTVWITSVTTSIMVFVVNETVFYLATRESIPDKSSSACTQIIDSSVYYRNVYTHMVFLHVLPTTTMAICAGRSLILSTAKCI